MKNKINEAEVLSTAKHLIETDKIEEAIQTLEKVRNSGCQTSALFALTLADIYKNKSIVEIKEDFSEAKEKYTKVIERALVTGDSEVLIVAKAELADCLLREARAEFASLETTKEGNQLEEWLKELFQSDEQIKLMSLRSGDCQPCPPNTGSTKLGRWAWKGREMTCYSCGS
jgi:hypothetical protein